MVHPLRAKPLPLLDSLHQKIITERVGDTIGFLPHKCHFPTLSSKYLAKNEVMELMDAFKKKVSSYYLFATTGNEDLKYLNQLTDKFQKEVRNKAPYNPLELSWLYWLCPGYFGQTRGSLG